MSPFLSFICIRFIWFYSFIRLKFIALNKDWLIILFLNFSFIVIVILYSYIMHKLLIFISVGVFIDPFAIIRWKSVEIDPEGACFVTNDALCTISINWHFISLIFNVAECCHWIWVSVDVVKSFFWKKCLIIFMLEQCSLHHKPSIWISEECFFILYACCYL